MFLISNLTNDPLQQTKITLPNGNPCTITLNFVERQIGWYITNLSYPAGNFTLNGFRIVNSPNMLYQWSNLIPFGLACVPNQDREPTQINDFMSGACSLYVLDQSEVDAVTEFLANGV